MDVGVDAPEPAADVGAGSGVAVEAPESGVVVDAPESGAGVGSSDWVFMVCRTRTRVS